MIDLEVTNEAIRLATMSAAQMHDCDANGNLENIIKYVKNRFTNTSTITAQIINARIADPLSAQESIHYANAHIWQARQFTLNNCVARYIRENNRLN